MKLLLLAIFWILFCIIHSLLIVPKVENYLKQKLNKFARFYRLFYNFIALASLLGVLYYSRNLQGITFYQVPVALSLALVILAIAIGLAGAKEYDMRFFLGLRTNTPIAQIKTSGILNWIRHPFYTATFLLLWSRNISDKSLITNGVLSAYLILGTLLEEQKLMREFGNTYEEYKKKAGMFLPKFKLHKKSDNR